MVGSWLFAVTSTNQIIRLDLTTGESKTNHVKVDEVMLLPAANGKHVYYLRQAKEGVAELGSLDPESLTTTPILEYKLEDFDRMPAISPDGRRVAFLDNKSASCDIAVYRGREVERRLSINYTNETMNLGQPCFSRSGDKIYASFYSEPEEADGEGSCGFIEIPLNGKPPRKTTLIPKIPKEDHASDQSLLLPIALSHDGKALAACPTFLWSSKWSSPENYALCVVDLTTWPHKIKRVPLSPPPEEQ